MRSALLKFVWTVLLFVTAPLANGAGAELPRTTRQMEALSKDEADRAVRRDLLSILRPPSPISSGMHRMLRGVGMTTRPYGTEYLGVCRRDSLLISYAPTEDGVPEDVPLRPYGIETMHLFHIADLPRTIDDGDGDRDLVWQPACAHLAGDDVGWFFADDALHALRGALLLDQAVREVKAGRLKAAPCPSVAGEGKATCEQAIIAAGKRDLVGSIASCPAAAGLLCYLIDLASSTKLTITARRDSKVPGRYVVTSIAIEEYIIVT